MTTGPDPRIRTDAGFGPGAVMLDRCQTRTALAFGESVAAGWADWRLYGTNRGPSYTPGMARSTAHLTTSPSSGDEPVEHRQRIQRTGRALGVVLDRLDRLLAVA